MTRHSTLTNPTDLHYAKVRSFTGDPANLTPDFADELIIATDTNKIYRATDTAQGALVELVAANNGGSNASIDQVYPSDRPTESGKFFYESWTNQLYISMQNFFGFRWWKPIQRLENFLDCTISIAPDSAITSSVTFSLMYSELSPSEIESGNFNFSYEIEANISTGNLDLSFYLNAYGKGAYTIGYSVDNPDSLATYTTLTTSTAPTGFEVRNSPFLINALTNKVSSTYFYFSGEKPDGFLSVDVEFKARNPPEL